MGSTAFGGWGWCWLWQNVLILFVLVLITENDSSQGKPRNVFILSLFYKFKRFRPLLTGKTCLQIICIALNVTVYSPGPHQEE